MRGVVEAYLARGFMVRRFMVNQFHVADQNAGLAVSESLKAVA